jgi:hypothetical protein
VVEDVDYPPEYQAAKQSSSQARLEAAGDVESSSGRVVREVAKQSGLEVEELEALLRRDPTLRTKPASKGGFKEAFRFAEDMARRGRATRSGIQEIRIGAVDGSTMPNLQMVGGAAGFALSESKKSRKKGDEDDDSKMRRAMRA